MNRHKVSDGDLVIVNGCMEGSWSDDRRYKFINAIKKWCNDRGLNNCDVLLVPGKEDFSITVMTVNDVFEDQVLNKE